jgi:hypothetical protein
MKLVDEPFLAANQKLQVMQRLELAIDRGAGEDPYRNVRSAYEISDREAIRGSRRPQNEH